MKNKEVIRMLNQHKRTFGGVEDIVVSTQIAIECVEAMESYCNNHNCSECWFYREDVNCGR